MRQRLRSPDFWILALAVLLNLLIARGAQAGMKDDVCYSGGEAVHCCSGCWIFCGCSPPV